VGKGTTSHSNHNPAGQSCVENASAPAAHNAALEMLCWRLEVLTAQSPYQT
jgi:hypothetical protein